MRSADMFQQHRIFKISGNNMGLVCPFITGVHHGCQVGYCLRCSVFADWQKKGEFLVLCAWCGAVLRRDPDHGKQVLSHGICPECKEKHFTKTSLTRKF